MNRSPEGNYVAVSSRGNFYLTWEPGQVSLRHCLNYSIGSVIGFIILLRFLESIDPILQTVMLKKIILVFGRKLEKLMMQFITCLYLSHTGSHIIGLLHGESRTWAGELMVASGFLSVVEDFTSARAPG